MFCCLTMADAQDREEAPEIFVDMLDEELLDQMFQEDISAVEEDLNIQEVSVYFTCGKCDKGYKTKGGLNRYTRAKHGERSTKEADGSATCELTSTGIFDLVKKTKDELCQNECYPKTMRDTIADCQFQPSKHLLGELKIAFAILKKYADGEKFYSLFYGKIVINAGTLIPDLPPPMCTLMAKKLGDNVLHYFKKQKQLPCQKPHSPISAKEMDGLQYLAGYVVSRFLKRIKNSPNYMSESSQSLLSVMNNFVEENNTSQRLIASQTRGGLNAVKMRYRKSSCVQKKLSEPTLQHQILLGK